MAKILISGGSGLVGQALSELLLKKGHEVRWLSRKPGNWQGIRMFGWDPAGGRIDSSAFDGVSHLVHLAGASIAGKRWSAAYKKEIIASRTESAALLFKTISEHRFPLTTLVGASATGYYGSGISSVPAKENAACGKDFLAQVCQRWEEAYLPFSSLGIRVVTLRTGVSLSEKGGAYPRLRPLFRLGLGAALGSGKQYFPWIHNTDLARLYTECLFSDQYTGVYNAVADGSTTNLDFSRALARSFDKPLLLPKVPEVFLKLVLGEMAGTLTGGPRISNEKLLGQGFGFKHAQLRETLASLADQ